MASNMCHKTWQGVRFWPWIGEHYKQSPLGFRLLVLGESHYERNFSGWAADYLDENFTGAFITECSGSHPLCIRVAELFGYGATASYEFWNSVCFYNYVQVALPTSKHRPTAEMWKASEEPFKTVLTGIKPDAILMLGQAVWNKTPYFKGCWNEPIQDGIGQHRRVWEYRMEQGHTALACAVHHPSRIWNSKRWEPVAHELRRRALAKVK